MLVSAFIFIYSFECRLLKRNSRGFCAPDDCMVYYLNTAFATITRASLLLWRIVGGANPTSNRSQRVIYQWSVQLYIWPGPNALSTSSFFNK